MWGRVWRVIRRSTHLEYLCDLKGIVNLKYSIAWNKFYRNAWHRVIDVNTQMALRVGSTQVLTKQREHGLDQGVPPISIYRAIHCTLETCGCTSFEYWFATKNVQGSTKGDFHDDQIFNRKRTRASSKGAWVIENGCVYPIENGLGAEMWTVIHHLKWEVFFSLIFLVLPK